MKRLIVFLLGLLQLGFLNTAEKKNYLKYESLSPKAQIFFNAHGIGFYIRPQDAAKLGSEKAYNNLLLSNVIRKSLEQGEGGPINSIQVPLSREEFLAFVNFAKLYAEMQSFEAFEEAFKDFDGIQILKSLQFDPEIIKEIQKNSALKEISSQEATKKRKRDEGLAEISKKFKGRMPEVYIERMKGRSHMTGLELTDEEVSHLIDIPSSIITDLIDIASPGEKITITLPDDLSNTSIPVLQNFVDIVIKSYSEDLFKNFIKIYPLIRFHININGFTKIGDIKNYLETLHKLADFFGYVRLSKGLRLILDQTHLLSNQVAFGILKTMPDKGVNGYLLNLLVDQKLIDKEDFQNIPLLIAKLNEIDKLNKLVVGNEKLDKLLFIFTGFLERLDRAKKARISNDQNTYMALLGVLDKAVTTMAQDLPNVTGEPRNKKQRFLVHFLNPLFSNDPLSLSILNNIYLD